MKKLIPFILLAIVFYAGWYYWQSLADRPLQVPLLTIAASDIDKVTVTQPNGEIPLTITRAGDEWVVARTPRQVLDQSVRAEAFITRLAELTTDSVARTRKLSDGISVVVDGKDGRRDELFFHQPAEGPPLGRVAATGDVFHLPVAAGRYLIPALSFDHYREAKVLHLLPGQVDSIVASRNDSLLWVVDSAVTPLANHLLAPAAAPYADYFDEIADRDRYHADLDFYFSGHAHRVRVFRDSLWPQPYVLVGNDFPRRFIGFSKLR